ncbi:hypothetical protein D3C72_1166260 [compost metagenome]
MVVGVMVFLMKWVGRSAGRKPWFVEQKLANDHILLHTIQKLIDLHQHTEREASHLGRRFSPLLSR